MHSESCLPLKGGASKGSQRRNRDHTCAKARELYSQTGKWPSGQLHHAQFATTHQAEEQAAVF